MFKELLHKSLLEIINEKEGYFEYFGTDGISFELWLTIELAYKLRGSPDISKVYCTPSIKSLTYNNIIECKEAYQCLDKRLDLVIENDRGRCAVEIKIAHPNTIERYSKNCVDDINKLKGISKSLVVEKLFILLVATRSTIDKYPGTKGGWNEWVKKIFLDPYIELSVTPNELHPSNIDKLEYTPQSNSALNTVLYIQSL